MTVSHRVSQFHIGFHKFGSETDINGIRSPKKRGFRNETLEVKPPTY